MPPFEPARPLTEADATAIVELSADVQRWLDASGSLQQIGPIRAEPAQAYARASAGLVVWQSHELAAALLLESEAAAVDHAILAELDLLQVPYDPRRPRWWLQKLMVRPSLHHHGLGAALLNAARRHVAERGGGRLVLDCWSGNEFLRNFYVANEFSFLGEFEVAGFSVAGFMAAIE